MRHRKAGRKLKRTASHRKALLSSLSTSLLRHKKIQTTLAKAKEAQKQVEAIITRAKRALVAEGDGKAKNIHARREVARVIKDRAVVKSLFEEIAPKVASRQGGYTRVVKLGQRQGDGAQVAVLELVDFDLADSSASGKTKRSRKTSKKGPPSSAAPANITKEKPAEEQQPAKEESKA
jgi:large subunit ribosomal protein L17